MQVLHREGHSNFGFVPGDPAAAVRSAVAGNDL